MKLKATIGSLLICLLICGLQAEKLYDVKCDNITGEEECQQLLPYCSTYAIFEDEDFDDLFTFTCTQCEPGFEAIPGGVKGVPRDYKLPSLKKLGIDFLQLCKRADTPAEGVNCNSYWCKRELPLCYKYTFKKDSDTHGFFDCLECDQMFTPREKSTTATITDLHVFKRTCARRLETRECGETCQEELPGCTKFKVSDSKFITVGPTEVERATFECLIPLEGYEVMKTLVTADTHPEIQKDTTLPNFQSSLQSCSDVECRHVLPYCLKYVTTQVRGEEVMYTCQTCQAGYKPKNNYRSFGSISKLARSNQYVKLCEAVTVSGIDCDSRCQQEMPGCKKFSISETSYLVGESIQSAKYSCDQCEDNYIKVDLDNSTIVHQNYKVTDNVKVVCRPKDVSEPVLCDEQCRKKYPHCKKYTAQKDEDEPASEESFRCWECDEGYEPTTSPDTQHWFSGFERVVCKHKETKGQIACDENCQKEFPHCEQLSITKNKEGHNSYQCHKCASGKFLIPYQANTAGVLAHHDSEMRLTNTIYLCAEQPYHLYQSLYTCEFADPSIFDHPECFEQRNCRQIVSMRDLIRGRTANRCVQCKGGYRLKAALPHPYDIDQDQCEAVKLQSTRLFNA